uniref:Beta-galactosidase n=1 Tax=Thermogemmatispora argillosa TaxID=2045280 RepID=A0A455T8W4_9CHLR|nr:beta-galactosidase [Thermogemmatispora argillosa]
MPRQNSRSSALFATLLYGADYNPEQWPASVWLEDMRLMKLAGLNMVSINIFSWALLEPALDQYDFSLLDRVMDLLAEHGIAADLGTATAAPPPWMSRQYPDILPVTREGLRLSHGSRQHFCPNSKNYRREAAELVRQLALRYRKHPALRLWHVNNEYGCHVPACYCDNCAVAFRAWLQQRYGSLEALNEAWGTTFWGQRYGHWEEILPPRLTPAQPSPSLCLDYQRFMSDSLLECFLNEARILREITPQIPVTTNLMAGFKPLDYFAWAPHLDVIAFDNYPAPTTPPSEVAFAHDLMRSLRNGQPHLVMEQAPGPVNWRPQNPQRRPGELRLQSLQAVARGADGVLYFQWRQSRAGAEKFHSAIVSHDGSERARIFREVEEIGAELKQLAPFVAGSRVPAQAALLMDWENWWAVEYQPGPSDRLRYWDLLLSYHQPLYALNIPVAVVSPGSDWQGYRLLIAPLLYLLRPGLAQKLETFVAGGGILLTTFFSGIVDANDRVMTGGYPAELRRLLGLRVAEFDPWTAEMSNTLVIEEGPLQGRYACHLWGEVLELEGAQALGRFASDYYAGGPALTVHHFGQGRAYYLATQPEQAFLQRLLGQLSQEAGLTPLLETPTGVEVSRRITQDERTIYFLLNHNRHEVRLSLPSGHFRRLPQGESISGEVPLAPRSVLVLLEES